MKTGRDMLAEHGTPFVTLKPQNLIQAAQADLKRAAHNREVGAPTIGKRMAETYQHYAFHRKHVGKSVTVQDLLRHALMEPECGRASGKYNTRLIYGDSALLLAAIRMVEGS